MEGWNSLLFRERGDTLIEGKGWVKIHRELLDKPIWILSSSEQKVILITLLLMANHRENKWEWNGRQYDCAPGQFVTSLERIAEKSGKDISIQNVRTAIKRFEKYDFLTNESTKTGRLITIVNWELYQVDDEEANRDADKDLTKSQQRPNKDLTTNKNVKNDKNVKNKKDIYSVSFEEFWEAYPRKKEKSRAFKCYQARIKEGYEENILTTAAKTYRVECESSNREERFIKHPATFLGPNKPFEDYICSSGIDVNSQEGILRTKDGRIIE